MPLTWRTLSDDALRELLEEKLRHLGPDEPFSFEHDGHVFQCEVHSGGVSSALPPARVVNAQWIVTVDGDESFALRDASVDDTPDDIREEIIAWYAQRRGD